METRESYWISSEPTMERECLSEDIACDVAVVGAGITGLTTAYLLARRGVHVVLIAGPVEGRG